MAGGVKLWVTIVFFPSSQSRPAVNVIRKKPPRSLWTANILNSSIGRCNPFSFTCSAFVFALRVFGPGPFGLCTSSQPSRLRARWVGLLLLRVYPRCAPSLCNPLHSLPSNSTAKELVPASQQLIFRSSPALFGFPFSSSLFSLQCLPSWFHSSPPG